MHKNRLLMSLIFALSYGAVACGEADDNNVDDSAESLKWGHASDGGALGDKRDDSDEHDGGKRHGGKLHVRGEDDGGCSFGGRSDGAGKDHGKGGHDEDRDDDSEENDDWGGKSHLDGGSKHGPSAWIDGGTRR